ncbi:MAG: hypothetical protein ACXADU_06730, partial [Promethearchaeota archaeon]
AFTIKGGIFFPDNRYPKGNETIMRVISARTVPRGIPRGSPLILPSRENRLTRTQANIAVPKIHVIIISERK